MPAHRDNTKKKGIWWLVKFYYYDREGNRKTKFKRGFKTKRDALEWEQEFLKKNDGSIDMKFKDFLEVYLNDMEQRLKPSTVHNKRMRYKNHMLPFFGEIPINEITVVDVRRWQNELQKNDFKPSTLRKNHNELSAVFNYAVQYYGLKENPCKRAGTIGNNDRKEHRVWTLEEYQEFIQYVDNPAFKVAYDLLFYTGLRIGELTALTPSDFDFNAPKLNVNKSLQVVGNKKIIGTPKTDSSYRDVFLPEEIATEVQEFIKTAFYGGLEDSDRIFTFNKESYRNNIRKICNKYDLKYISPHDFRHSHATMLIELGYNPVLVSKRLGHKDVAMTLNKYSHLYPDKQKELSKQLNNLIKY